MIIIYMIFSPVNLIVLGFTLFPYGEEGGKPLDNLPFFVIYDFLLPMAYSYFLIWFTSTMVEVNMVGKLSVANNWTRNYRTIMLSFCCAILTFVAVLLSGYYIEFPVKFNIVYFFLIQMVCFFVFVYSIICRAKSQMKQEKSRKLYYVQICTVSLTLGWSFAIGIFGAFNKGGFIMQTLIVSAIVLWKMSVVGTIKKYSLMTSYHGHNYELFKVCFSCASVIW